MATSEPSLLQKLQQKIALKEQLEKDIKRLTDLLLGPGGLGLHGGIIDSEGFPINDVEKIIETTKARNELAVKKNDIEALMEEIERGLLEVHAEAKEKKEALKKAQGGVGSSPSFPAPSKSESNEPPHQAPPVVDPLAEFSHLQPFAVVNSVAAGSPSEKSGLKEKDLIVKFSDLDTSNNQQLKAIPSVVKENVPVVIIVKRDVRLVKLVLVPQKWTGKGLLGCHLIPTK